MKFRQSISPPAQNRPICVIGAGGIVTDAHLPAYTKAGWKVMGIVDLDYSNAQQVKDRFPIIQSAFLDLDEMILAANGQQVVFDLALPADQILSTLQKLPDEAAVLIQKPMGETLATAREIMDLCRKKRLVAAVNFQLKFAPYMLALEDMIHQNLVGEIYDLELKVCVHTPWGLWDFLKSKPRLEVLYHSIHYLDLIRNLAGMPSRVLASLASHPNTPNLADTRSSILMEYTGYKRARILTNHGHDFGNRHQESYFKVEGTKGAIHIVLGLSLDYPVGRPSKMEYYLKDSGLGWQEIPLLGDWFPDAFMGSMALLQNHLLDPTIPLIHGLEPSLQTMELVEQVYQSADQTN